MITAFWIAGGVLSITILVGMVRLITARDSATRAVVGDLVFFSCLGLLALFGMTQASSVSVDLALLAAVLGILATIALARIITRGQR
ncbi:transporter [Arachnia propionica]|uniref:Transporter n=1 Tax=Arachnia propionica TaxID=1750 RepID=A0A3P1TE29_9ACTN|nr:monovalent cation/H+ antiporter complex subunit F [Arachnia propionica]MDO5082001.1 monovalent cation/H+ antiporter complex subunit F [Arachnia propionica]RRD07156.1 transporter [Arachnia propionica]